MNIKEKAFSGIKWTTTSSVLTIAIRFVQVAVLARLLSPADFGLMAMSLIIIDITMGYVDLGISAGIIHHQNISSDELSSLYWLNIFVGTLVFLLICGIRSWFEQLFQQPQLNEIVLWISLTFIITPASSQFKVLLQRDLLFNQLAFQEVVSKLAEAIVAITLAFLGYRVWSLVVGYLCGATTNTLILFFIGFKKYRPRLRFRFSEIRKYLAFGLYQMANNTISILTMKVDQIIIGRLLGVQSLGIYYFASNLAHQPLSKIAPIFKKVLFPVFSKIQDETDKLQNGFLKLNKMLMFVLAPIAMGVIVLAPKWVVPIFGQKWIETIGIIQILAFLELLKTPGSTYSSLVLAKGKPKALFVWSVFQFTLRVISIYFAAKSYGINGVIYILLIIQLVGMVPSYLILVKPFVEVCFLTFLKAIYKPFFASILMAIFVLSVSKFVKVNYIYLIVDIATGITSYFLVIFLIEKGIYNDIKSLIFSKVIDKRR